MIECRIIHTAHLIDGIGNFFCGNCHLFHGVDEILFHQNRTECSHTAIGHTVSGGKHIADLKLYFLPAVIFILLHLRFRNIPSSLFFQQKCIEILVKFIARRFFLSLINLYQPVINRIDICRVKQSKRIRQIIQCICVSFPQHLRIHKPKIEKHHHDR